MSQPVEALRNAFKIPELKSRIIFTLIMLAVYRLGAHVPTPGVDGGALSDAMGTGGLLSFYDMFSGGAFSNATVFALGIMPYISASIIIQLLTAVWAPLERLAKEGAEGQKKITEYTRYGTIGLCIVQSLFVAAYLVKLNTPELVIVPNPSPFFYILCVISFTTGTAFIMWLGEQISEHGVGNGISLIIFVSIVSRMPEAVYSLFQQLRNDDLTMFEGIMLIVVMVLVVAGVILVTTGQRRIPVQYPRQVKGRRVTAGGRNYLPLRVNQAGVIPIIFASSILMLPSMVMNAVKSPEAQAFFQHWFEYDSLLYNLVYAGLIIFFCFFYTAITFNPVEIAENLKKYGGVVMGVRPGKATAEYLNRVMTRITLVGAVFLAGVALLPKFVNSGLGVQDFNVSQFFGGTSLLILVGVALDTVRQVEQHLIMRNYDGFMKSGRKTPGRR
ncbi:MAG: preprotein translocase subunit SecY [Candidatus Hydrogenedentes bacterium]|nr:preprotein translocase subunit SecY [Candidatus Hydrogenedentota bacterium]MDY0032183.1 preprotein translocase subunit SecY [FCB group bacterium]NLT59361.1 preprotein translocase subunit SecY [Candidatus Hydrogenedentota bacterium]HNV21713.1 preprotein translocase subunit SecY [Candidatus Hydrogenedentota bacterium]HNZ19966.1 preprotein translocase subunit SecY [Candidatus Hydrogenedentota bacterium]